MDIEEGYHQTSLAQNREMTNEYACNTWAPTLINHGFAVGNDRSLTNVNFTFNWNQTSAFAGNVQNNVRVLSQQQSMAIQIPCHGQQQIRFNCSQQTSSVTTSPLFKKPDFIKNVFPPIKESIKIDNMSKDDMSIKYCPKAILGITQNSSENTSNKIKREESRVNGFSDSEKIEVKTDIVEVDQKQGPKVSCQFQSAFPNNEVNPQSNLDYQQNPSSQNSLIQNYQCNYFHPNLIQQIMRQFRHVPLQLLTTKIQSIIFFPLRVINQNNNFADFLHNLTVQELQVYQIQQNLFMLYIIDKILESNDYIQWMLFNYQKKNLYEILTFTKAILRYRRQLQSKNPLQQNQ